MDEAGEEAFPEGEIEEEESMSEPEQQHLAGAPRIDTDHEGLGTDETISPKRSARPSKGLRMSSPPPGAAGISSDVRKVLDYVASFEEDLVEGHGGRVVIKPQAWESRVVWAKLQGFPWWPAQVLMPGDPFIPRDEPVPRGQDPVPVRFFGTYDFAWITTQKGLVPLYSGYTDKVHSEITDPEFIKAVLEAQVFQMHRALPEGFALAMEEEDDPGALLPPVGLPVLEAEAAAASSVVAPKPKPKPSKKAKKAKEPAALEGAGGSILPGLASSLKKPKSGASRKKDTAKRGRDPPGKGGAEKGDKKAKSGKAPQARTRPEAVSRVVRIARQMGLLPPADSPFATQLCVHPDLMGMMA